MEEQIHKISDLLRNEKPSLKSVNSLKEMHGIRDNIKRFEEILDSTEDEFKKKIIKELSLSSPANVENLFTTAINESFKSMLKQWHYLAASMVKVKRSINLNNFSEQNLWVNPRYGVKVYKCHSNTYILSIFNIKHDLIGDNEFMIRYDNDIFYSNNSEYDFSALDSIPQLDKERLSLLKDLTKDIVDMYTSWKRFVFDNDYVYHITLIKNAYSQLSSYRTPYIEHYEKIFNNSDKIISFNNTCVDRIAIKKEECDSVINKWKEINKNYLVYNQLAKIDLNI